MHARPIFLSYQDTFVLGTTCTYQIKRTYTGRDVCNNVKRFVQVLNVRDNIPPAITTVAQNMGIECDQATNVQAAFEAWLNNKGGSIATDGCNSGLHFLRQYRAAIPLVIPAHTPVCIRAVWILPIVHLPFHFIRGVKGSILFTTMIVETRVSVLPFWS